MTGAVERMESGGRQHRCIADVVQPGSSDQVRAIGLIERLADAPGPLGDTADVLPAWAEEHAAELGGQPLEAVRDAIGADGRAAVG
jgi:hypothetical protein